MRLCEIDHGIGLLDDPRGVDQAANGHVNTLHDLIQHLQLRTFRMPVGSREVEVPATPRAAPWDARRLAAAPALDEQGRALSVTRESPGA